MSKAMNLLDAARALISDLKKLRFGSPVECVYNPLEYAWAPFEQYINRFGSKPREIVLLGMNPGPFGMAQTGVPFGDIEMVRNWMGIEGPVEKPAAEHPKRPIQGFKCPRGEVSGTRVWGWAKDSFGPPEAFFARFFVANYCPLCFVEATGRNRTPDKLPTGERKDLFEACDLHLRRTIEFLAPSQVIGIGAFAETRARQALDGSDLKIGRILHPSPASPKANRGWAAQATAELAELGISITAG